MLSARLTGNVKSGGDSATCGDTALYLMPHQVEKVISPPAQLLDRSSLFLYINIS